MEKYLGSLGCAMGKPHQELASWDLWRGFFGEFLATFMFLFISISTVMHTTQDGVALNVGRQLTISWAFGMAITVLIYVFGTVSGANINPAVSLMLALTKKISPVRCVVYIIAQCLGAICGSALVKSFNEDLFAARGAACNGVADGYSNGAALAVEIFSTGILMLAVQAATDPKQDARAFPQHPGQGAYFNNGLAPLTIGLAVFLAHLIAIPVTNCSINPARSLGTAVVGHGLSVAGQADVDCFDDLWIWWVGPMLSAVIFSVIYQVLIADKTKYRQG